MFSSALLIFLAAAASLAPGMDAAPNGTVGSANSPSTGGTPPPASSGSSSIFLTGSVFGVVPPATLTLIDENPDAVKEAAGVVLKKILETNVGFTGEEKIEPIDSQMISVDKVNNLHIRFKQHVAGLPIDGASLAIHLNGVTGQVFAVNGQAHSFSSIPNGTAAAGDEDCDAAMEVALADYKKQLAAAGRLSDDGEWLSACEVAAVQGRDGNAYLAYKKLFGFQPPPVPVDGVANTNTTVIAETEPYQMDMIYAERSTGRFVAVHPKVFGARTMDTYNCNSLFADFLSECDVASTSPNKINSGDPTVDLAHNNLVDIYSFYLSQFGRKSMDGNDMKIQTLTHYGEQMNNAFFTAVQGGFLAFGDGDGAVFGNWAQLDVGTFLGH
jgi:Zn-dependent metalloprotease